MIFIFLSSGIFLGWSLGANDAANIFGTAVSTKMIRFKVAAVIAGLFVILGAVIGGAGTTHTLGTLGSVNALAGAFMVAFSAGFTVFLMTKYRLPVSTSQAIVGSIIGWNFYANFLTDSGSLTKIVSTWVLCPVLAALIAIALYFLTRWVRTKVKINLFAEDYRTRVGLILIGAFGAYSLGANNIANVMGVFVSAQPIGPIDIFGVFTLSGTQILFLIGGIAIAVGIITYSHKVMDTVGANILQLSPITAFIVVLAESIVLFIFSSEGLEAWLIGHGLPAFPLVPVSSSQAVVGAVIGIGLIKNFRTIRLKVLGEIAAGWITTPIISGLITFVFLFFLQNVFNQEVYVESEYVISEEVVRHLQERDIQTEKLNEFTDRSYVSEIGFYNDLRAALDINRDQIIQIINVSKISRIFIDPLIVSTKLDTLWFSGDQILDLKILENRMFEHRWQFEQALKGQGAGWTNKPASILNREFNQSLNAKYEYLYRIFEVKTLD
jgi:PiT family inorganic phosphate transporter